MSEADPRLPLHPLTPAVCRRLAGSSALPDRARESGGAAGREAAEKWQQPTTMPAVTGSLLPMEGGEPLAGGSRGAGPRAAPLSTTGLRDGPRGIPPGAWRGDSDAGGGAGGRAPVTRGGAPGGAPPPPGAGGLALRGGPAVGGAGLQRGPADGAAPLRRRHPARRGAPPPHTHHPYLHGPIPRPGIPPAHHRPGPPEAGHPSPRPPSPSPPAALGRVREGIAGRSDCPRRAGARRRSVRVAVGRRGAARLSERAARRVCAPSPTPSLPWLG